MRFINLANLNRVRTGLSLVCTSGIGRGDAARHGDALHLYEGALVAARAGKSADSLRAMSARGLCFGKSSISQVRQCPSWRQRPVGPDGSPASCWIG